MTTSGLSAYCRIYAATKGLTCESFEAKDETAEEKLKDLVGSQELRDKILEDDDYFSDDDGEGKPDLLVERHGPNVLDSHLEKSVILPDKGLQKRYPKGSKSYKIKEAQKFIDLLFCDNRLDVKRLGGLDQLNKLKTAILGEAEDRIEGEIRGLAAASIHIIGKYTADEAARLMKISRRSVFNHLPRARFLAARLEHIRKDNQRIKARQAKLVHVKP